MAEQIISVPSMHEDHRKWQSQHSMWQDDLLSWQKQLKFARKEAEELLKMLEHQTDVLSCHKSKIDMQESTLKAHEYEIASSEHFGSEVPEALTTKHFEMVKHAESLSGEHETIKNHHRGLVAKLSSLQKTLTATR